MPGFTWIQATSFLVLSHLTAATGQSVSDVIVKSGDEVTLPCKDVSKDYNRCENVDWFYRAYPWTDIMELVKFGKIQQSISGGLNVADCSLVIKNVTDDHTGLYTCRVYKSIGKQSHDTHTNVSVVLVTQWQENNTMNLGCTVFSYEHCAYKLDWLFVEDGRDVQISQRYCQAMASFSTSHFLYTSKAYQLFKCKVTDSKTEEVHLFTLNPQASARTHCSTLNYIMLAMRMVEILLLTVITLLLFRAQRAWKLSENNTGHNNLRGRDKTMDYENVGDPSALVKQKTTSA